MSLHPTSDPSLRSFIEVPADHFYPIQNLPFGVFRRRGGSLASVGVRIGDYVLDCAVLEERRLFRGEYLLGRRPFSQSSLNMFMGLGKAAWTEARRTLQELLSHDNPTLQEDVALLDQLLVRIEDAEVFMPAHIGDYTDFYASRQHATNVGTMFRGADNALQPNWLHLPVGYHGRASSVVLSGTNVVRPNGQRKGPDDPVPVFGPSRLLDFELELGTFVGVGNDLGHPIPIRNMSEHIFGMVLVNDWSARDIQAWEYVPLGPFLGKNFATSISPWIVPMEALEPFRVNGEPQEGDNPEVLPYLRQEEPRVLDIELEVLLQPEGAVSPTRIVQGNARYLYWSFEQQLAHHTINGCNMRSGDLIASGTISGDEEQSFGSLLERTWRGTKPLTLADGSSRTFMEDGDTLTIRGWAQGDGYRIGLGEVTGTILPAPDHL